MESIAVRQVAPPFLSDRRHHLAPPTTQRRRPSTEMGVSAPAYTPAWPEKAFGASRRVRSASAVEGGGGRRLLSLQPSTHRHSHEAHAFNNPVIRSYLMEETYQDYRGPCFKARRTRQGRLVAWH